jgi:hypothetical protein
MPLPLFNIEIRITGSRSGKSGSEGEIVSHPHPNRSAELAASPLPLAGEGVHIIFIVRG